MASIRIKYHNPELEKLNQISIGNWIDLRAAEDVHIDVGDNALISLGVSMKLPRDHEAHIIPRSSTFKNWGILQVNGMGVVDSAYCGDDDIWKFWAYATRETRIHTNDRICQFRIMQVQPAILFEEVESLDSRSRGGFGSTGINEFINLGGANINDR